MGRTANSNIPGGTTNTAGITAGGTSGLPITVTVYPSEVQTSTVRLKEGYIKKWVNLVSGFKKRYFVLTRDLLVYYKEKKGIVSEKGQISIKLARVDPRNMNDRKMIIATGTNEIHLEFSSVEEKREWLQAIDQCKRALHYADMPQYNEEFKDEPAISSAGKISEGSKNSNNQEQLEKDQELQQEIKRALNIALQSNILKEDSALSVNLAETWAQHASFEDALGKFKSAIQLNQDRVPAEICQYGEKLEQTATDLKHAVTNAIKQIEETKLQIIKILEFQDHLQRQQQMQQQLSTGSRQNQLSVVPENESEQMQEESKNNYVSFSQDFNEQVERKGNVARTQKSNRGGNGTLRFDENGNANHSSQGSNNGNNRRVSALGNNQNHLETTGMNFQTCVDEGDEGFSSANFRGGNTSQKFQSFINDNLDDDDEFREAFNDEETLKQVQSEIQKQQFDDTSLMRTCRNAGDFLTSRQNEGINQEEEQNEDSEIEEVEYRTMLPALKPPDQKVSVWKVIKDAVGKDLSRFCVPVYFNEPISMLQKVAEIMEYEDLLVQAVKFKDDSVRRLLYVTAFGIAQYKCSDRRTNKPFNPILGETFEYLTPKFKYFSEQVSHHPPISACYAQSEGTYEFWMNSNMKTNFWGKSLEVKPLGLQHVRLHTGSTIEHYTIERINSSVNNLIFGEMYVEHSGIMTVRNLARNETCLVEFKKRGWSGKGACEIDGYVISDSNPKDKRGRIFGKWTESLTIQMPGQTYEEQIWKANPMPDKYESMYYFTMFTLQLNYLPDSLRKHLPPTDSRFRPDQRALECGDLIKASDEKARLEDKQRKMRKDRELSGHEYKSRYFEEYYDEESKEKGYKYGVRDYWEDRKKSDWSHLEDLF